jgi:hypothetical protein
MAAELDIPQQYAVRLRDDLGWDELVSIGRALESGSKWLLGDLACRVETSYGAGDLARYAEEVGVDYATLRGYKAVSHAFPAESVLRSTHPWSVYRVLVSLPDRLELVSGEAMTKAQAGELAASRRKPRAPRPRRRPEEETSPPPGSEPPGEDGRPPVGPGRAADGTGTAPGGQEAAGEPGQPAPADGQASPDGAAPEMPAMQAGDPEAAWQALCELYQALPADQQRAFLRWTPQVSALLARVSDPAWLREQLARVQPGSDGQAPAAAVKLHEHLWEYDEDRGEHRCTVTGCGQVLDG